MYIFFIPEQPYCCTGAISTTSIVTSFSFIFQQEQVETPNEGTSSSTAPPSSVPTGDVTPVTTVSAVVAAAAEVNGEEAEEALDVELPPPMEIQTHSFPSRPTSQEDVHSKIVSILSIFH